MPIGSIGPARARCLKQLQRERWYLSASLERLWYEVIGFG